MLYKFVEIKQWAWSPMHYVLSLVISEQDLRWSNGFKHNLNVDEGEFFSIDVHLSSVIHSFSCDPHKCNSKTHLVWRLWGKCCQTALLSIYFISAVRALLNKVSKGIDFLIRSMMNNNLDRQACISLSTPWDTADTSVVSASARTTQPSHNRSLNT